MSWSDIVAEATCEKDEFMLDVMSENIIAFKSFPQALSHLLAIEFKSNISYEKWLALFQETLHSDSLYHTGMDTVETMAFLDLLAIRDRDPACIGLVHPFLYSKGYKALQAHRVAHVLWHSDRKVVARVIQSRCCELYDVDIHPNAVIGW